MPQEEKLLIPEMVFGHLLTGSNFDDSVSKVTGGRNGYGAKLCNIFSKSFTVETVDSKRGLKYVQTWNDSMHHTSGPVVTQTNEQDYTKVTFTPDLKLFGMSSLEETDLLRLFERRYAHSAC
jgi:DNA topoisomerase-2